MSYDDIIDSIRLDEVLLALGVDVTRIRNGNHWANCILHDDRNTHFSINEDTLVGNCYHCGGFNLPTLVIRSLDLEDDEYERAWDKAVEWLLPFSDGVPDDDDTDGFREQIQKYLHRDTRPVRSSRGGDLPTFSERVLKDLEPVPMEILAKWNIDHQITADAFKLGYDPERERGSYVGPAIVIPHFWKGKLVGYQERWLDDDRPKNLPKYTNSEDFPKRETLYNYDQASRDGAAVVVVESVMSVIRLWEIGYLAVATFGGSISDRQYRILRNLDQGVILACDNDEIGRKVLRQASIKLAGEVPLYQVPFPKGEKADLADIPEEDVHLMLEYSRPVFAGLTDTKR